MAGEDYLGLLGVGDLAAFNQSVTQSDPYGITSRTLNSWAPDTSTWSPVESGVGLFAKSFLAGLLGNQARQNAAQQTNALISVLPQLRSDPMNVALPEGMNPEAFANFRGTAALKNYLAKEQEAQTQKKFDSDLLARMLGKRADVIGEAVGKRDIYGPNTFDPDSPAAKQLSAIKAEEDAARNEILTATKYPAVSKLQTTSTALSQLKNIKDLNTASSDIPFATLFIGGLDGSVVREGEYDRVAGSNPFLIKFKNQLESALNGSSSLGVEVKQQMYRELQKTQKGLYAEALLQTAPRIATAKQRGADPKNILPFDPEMKFEEEAPIVDPISLVDQELARRGLAPDGTPLRAPLPTGPVVPY